MDQGKVENLEIKNNLGNPEGIFVEDGSYEVSVSEKENKAPEVGLPESSIQQGEEKADVEKKKAFIYEFPVSIGFPLSTSSDDPVVVDPLLARSWDLAQRKKRAKDSNLKAAA